MNYVFSSAASAPQYFSTAFKEVLLPQVTEQQKKILIISSIAFSILTAIFVAYRCCLSDDPYQGGGAYASPIASPQSSFNFGGSPQIPTKKYTYSPPSSPQPSFSPIPKLQPSFTHYTPAYKQPASIPDPVVFKPVQPPIYNPTKPVVGHSNSAYPSAPRKGLDGIEDEIKALQEEMHMQQQILAFIQSTVSVKAKKDDDPMNVDSVEIDSLDPDLQALQHQLGMEEAELKLLELQDKLDAILVTYPETVRKYLEDKFSTYSNNDSHEIYDHLVMLSGFMETHADNEAFVHNSLKQIDAFLTKSLFTSATELCLQEEKKVNLIVFHEFFSIVDKHLDVIATRDRQLMLNLKVKLANLPLTDQIDPKTKAPKDRRELFPNAHLSEQDQVAILADHFQSEEDKAIANVIIKIQSKKCSDKDLKKLSKMISTDRSKLSLANKKKLQEAIEKAISKSVFTGSANSILVTLKSHFKGASDPYYGTYNYGYSSDSTEIETLHRASKAKQYFGNQIGLPEEKTQIPRWYHATKQHSMVAIINSVQVNVEHKQAFKGAWVSTQREYDFGESVFVFSHRITKLDPNVFIGYEKGKVRWRGLQCPIPLYDTKKVSNISLVGLYKGISKIEKEKIISNLKSKGLTPVTVSVTQVDYIQKEIIKTIGNPNLTEKWWGKADVSYLDKQIPQHHKH